MHAVLTILGLEATPDEIQTLYDRESSYQKPRYPIDEDVVKSMSDKDKFKDFLDQQPHYSNFLLFFQREIESKGAKEALEEHLFADTDHARRLFPRVFCSQFVKPASFLKLLTHEIFRYLSFVYTLGICF